MFSTATLNTIYVISYQSVLLADKMDWRKLSTCHKWLTNFIKLICINIWVGLWCLTFDNISVISWRSVLLVEETGAPEKYPSPCRKSLTNYIWTNIPRNWPVTQNVSKGGIITDCTGRCKSNCHMIAVTISSDIICKRYLKYTKGVIRKYIYI